MSSLVVRDAAVEDARAIAAVHVTSWQAAYRGLMPDEVLDNLSVTQRETRWQHTISDPDAASRTLVAIRDGDVLGWASFGPGRDDGCSHVGELWGLYASPDAFSTGVGHALITTAESALVECGYESAYLWVLDGNQRAINFYARHGWIADDTIKVDERKEMSARTPPRAEPALIPLARQPLIRPSTGKSPVKMQNASNQWGARENYSPCRMRKLKA